MDGVEGQCGQLLFIAATNRLENLDPVSGFILLFKQVSTLQTIFLDRS